MRLESEKFKSVCSTIKTALDSKGLNTVYSDTLELVADNNKLVLNVKGREYFVSLDFMLDEQVANFRAPIAAKTFIDLISKMTSQYIDIDVENNVLKVHGNGDYKLPLVTDLSNANSLLVMPKIDITNVNNSFEIDTEILQRILNFNSKELQRGEVTSTLKEYYYIDDKGCITFTSGACVNDFTLPYPIKILISDKVVKLFKLFKDHDKVMFTIGHDPLNDNTIETKVKFETLTEPKVSMTVITYTTKDIVSVPVEPLREIAAKEFPYSAVVNREELLQAISRLTLFNTVDKVYGIATFRNGAITITDWSKNNSEIIYTTNDCPSLVEYSLIFNLNKFNLYLTNSNDEFITMCFGDNKALVIKHPNVSDIIPEYKKV